MDEVIDEGRALAAGLAVVHLGIIINPTDSILREGLHPADCGLLKAAEIRNFSTTLKPNFKKQHSVQLFLVQTYLQKVYKRRMATNSTLWRRAIIAVLISGDQSTFVATKKDMWWEHYLLCSSH